MLGKDICTFFSGDHGSFSRSRVRGTQGVRLYTTAQVWVPGGLRGACSGRPESRNLASNHRVAFRGAWAEQDNGQITATAVKRSNTVTIIASSSPRSYSHGPYYVFVDHCHTCVVMTYACMRCVCAPCTYSHGTTAIASQQLCVVHFYARVNLAYTCECVMCVLSDT